jgi:UDPglucose 6-dehydrogenase
VLGATVSSATSVRECASVADVLVIATPWPEFSELSPAWVKPGAAVIDLWRMVKTAGFAAKAKIVYVGRGDAATNDGRDAVRVSSS